MEFFDALSAAHLGYLFYPNWTIAVLLLMATPLACLCSVEVNAVISARAAQQFGNLIALPFGALYVLGEIQIVTLDAPTLLVISAILALVDFLLFFVSRATFRREEILTKWK